MFDENSADGMRQSIQVLTEGARHSRASLEFAVGTFRSGEFSDYGITATAGIAEDLQAMAEEFRTLARLSEDLAAAHAERSMAIQARFRQRTGRADGE